MGQKEKLNKILDNLWDNPNLTDLRKLENILKDEKLLTPKIEKTLSLLWQEQINSSVSNRNLRDISKQLFPNS